MKEFAGAGFPLLILITQLLRQTVVAGTIIKVSLMITDQTDKFLKAGCCFSSPPCSQRSF
jgi:hypothetical protein